MKINGITGYGRIGFTLIEVMSVLLILSILFGLILGLYRHASESSKTARMSADIGILNDALSRYVSEFGEYPAPEPNDGDVYTNAVAEFWDEPFHTESVLDSIQSNHTLRAFLPADFTAIDPWGHPYMYLYSTNAPLSYKIYTQPR